MIPSSRNPRADSIPRAAGNDHAGGSSSSSVRPRNRRLISTGEQELVSTSGTSTPSGSRGVSPIPQKHPSRGASGDNGKVKPVGGLLASSSGNEAGKGGRGSPVGILGGWGIGSWSSWQGLANSVLGGTEGDLSSSQRKGKGVAWGPEMLPKQNDGGIGGGTTAEREATVRRRRMRRVLEGVDELPNALDTNGNYKHRTSMDEQRPGTSQDEAGDALVYIHHVQPNDTLAGVVLRYNCPPEVFRKSNRMWPNDSIQIRKTVVLPVDACAIKGRPCDAPTPDSQGVDLLAPTPGIEEPPSLSNGTAAWPSGVPSSQNDSSIGQVPNEDEEKPWTHVRWVLLDSSPLSKPVEIARMPRKTLGYFPPRRRKSQSLTMSSVTSTPRASSEHGPESVRSNTTPLRRGSSLAPNSSVSVVPGSYFPPPAMIATKPRTRIRHESINDQSWMSGPGGVGTLGKSVGTPGPAKDSMNAWVKKHFPGIAIDSMPSVAILGGETAHFGFTGDGGIPTISEGVPGTSTPLLGSNGLGIENAAAAVEGWIRRTVSKGVPGTPKGGGRREEVDLIELLDGSDDGKFELSPGRISTGREDMEGLVRGRTRAGSKGMGGKSGKSD